MASKAAQRLSSGGLIDRSQSIGFTLDGKQHSGFLGDTVASALLAENRWLLGRSFKYHRPRGLLSAGVDEPNALLTLHEDGCVTPNLPATQLELRAGMVLSRQNGFPSVDFDLMAINGLLSPIFGAGFYYKTFMGLTRGAWMWFEPWIRRAAGLGKARHFVDPHRYDIQYHHTDVLIIGAGAAGVAAAHHCLGSGQRVLVLEQDFVCGGELNAQADAAQLALFKQSLSRVTDDPLVTLKTRTTAMGLYDEQCVVALEKKPTHTGVEERLLIIRSKCIVFATGCFERPVPFADNDKPGVLLASAVATYTHRYAIQTGQQILLTTQNDTTYRLARQLAGVHPSITLLDARAHPNEALVTSAAQVGVRVLTNATVVRAVGSHKVEGALILEGERGPYRHIACDVIGMSGGLTPCVHLTSHNGVKPVFTPSIMAFVPGQLPAHQAAAGSVCGQLGFAAALLSGERAAQAMLATLAVKSTQVSLASSAAESGYEFAEPALMNSKLSAARRAGGKIFIDFQNDVTVKDIQTAFDEGYESVEHLKRYTTLGMGTDQGKSANLNGLFAMAELRGITPSQAGTTTYRPPVVPLTVGAIAGRTIGRHFRPIRRTPLHEWHSANGATMTEAGLWLRPWFYAWAGKDVATAYVAEMTHVRTHVGLSDVSSLGKIDVQGPDAAVFLDRIYVNAFAKLPVGKARYGVMLNTDGIVLDDGTTARVGEQRYFLTTTTAQAAEVMSHLEFLLDTVWPDLKVRVSSITDQWAGMSLAGPKARQVLERAFPDWNVSNDAVPFMGVVDWHWQQVPVRLMRLSFSGELAYELYIPADYAIALWRHLLTAGESLLIRPYGLEALAALRIEKGHVAGLELDHRTTLKDLGLARMASKTKPYIGQVLSQRADLVREDRWELVGLKPLDAQVKLRGGSILFKSDEPIQGHGRGYITSVTYSPELGCHIALGLYEGGIRSIGQRVIAAFPLKNEQVELEVVSPIFIDPKGERLHG
jgi:methylglutamate dehydrogenase subunit C